MWIADTVVTNTLQNTPRGKQKERKKSISRFFAKKQTPP
jgi:hypothetical protein